MIPPSERFDGSSFDANYFRNKILTLRRGTLPSPVPPDATRAVQDQWQLDRFFTTLAFNPLVGGLVYADAVGLHADLAYAHILVENNSLEKPLIDSIHTSIDRMEDHFDTTIIRSFVALEGRGTREVIRDLSRAIEGDSALELSFAIEFV